MTLLRGSGESILLSSAKGYIVYESAFHGYDDKAVHQSGNYCTTQYTTTALRDIFELVS